MLQVDHWGLQSLIDIGSDDEQGLAQTFVESGISGPDFAMETVYAYRNDRQFANLSQDEYLRGDPDAVIAIGTPQGQMVARRVELGKGTNGSDLLTTPHCLGLDWVRTAHTAAQFDADLTAELCIRNKIMHLQRSILSSGCSAWNQTICQGRIFVRQYFPSSDWPPIDFPSKAKQQ